MITTVRDQNHADYGIDKNVNKKNHKHQASLIEHSLLTVVQIYSTGSRQNAQTEQPYKPKNAMNENTCRNTTTKSNNERSS